MRALSAHLLRAGLPAAFSTLTLPAQTVVDFADVVLASPPTQAYAEGGVYYNGSDLAGGFTSRGVSFATAYNPDWGSWSGWAYSTTTDTTTPGYGNQYSAFSGSGEGDAAYAVGYVGYSGLSLAFPKAAKPRSVALTNSTYAGLSMTFGDAFAKKFGGADGTDPDTFILTITGLDGSGAATGSVEVYLADFRSADPAGDFILETWQTVDLSALGTGVKELLFSLSSTDVGAWGLNTPTYFALDNLTVEGLASVPEASALPLLTGLIAFLGRRRRR